MDNPPQNKWKKFEHQCQYWWGSIPLTIKIGALVLLIVLVVAVIGKVTQEMEEISPSRTKSSLKDLIKNATYWYKVSMQDKSSQVAALHIAYAITSLENARMFASNKYLSWLCKVDIEQMYKDMYAFQKSLHQ